MPSTTPEPQKLSEKPVVTTLANTDYVPVVTTIDGVLTTAIITVHNLKTVLNSANT